MNTTSTSNIWQGVVIEESLNDKSLLEGVKVIGTKITKLENESRQVTFHNIEIADALKNLYVNKAKQSIKPGFYTHLCKDGTMIVIFSNQVFQFSRNDPGRLLKAREYGRSMGIITEQMPFEHLIDHPFD